MKFRQTFDKVKHEKKNMGNRKILKLNLSSQYIYDKTLGGKDQTEWDSNKKLKRSNIKQRKYKSRIHTWPIILCFITFSLSRIFMATLSPVSTFLANFTFAKVPSPNVLPSSYLPTLVLPLPLFDLEPISLIQSDLLIDL